MGYRTQEDLVAEIARLREERGLSQADVAESLDLDPSAISRLERGERGLAVTELAAIAGLLEMSVEQLVYENANAEDAVAFRGDPGLKDQVVGQVDELIDNLLYYRALIR